MLARALLFIITMTSVGNVYAVGQMFDARITGVYCGIEGGKNMCSVYFNKKSTGTPPACASVNYRHRMQFSADSNIGKSLLSLSLSAHALNKVVVVLGNGSCNIHYDTESLDTLFIAPKCSESFNTWGCTNI